MQESHSIPTDEKRWAAEWGSKIWFDHGDSNSKGVAIMFDKNFDIEVHNVIRSEKGRYLILYASHKKNKIVFANLYAPNKDDQSFFVEVFKELERFTPNFTIIGGRF